VQPISAKAVEMMGGNQPQETVADIIHIMVALSAEGGGMRNSSLSKYTSTIIVSKATMPQESSEPSLLRRTIHNQCGQAANMVVASRPPITQRCVEIDLVSMTLLSTT
jgi:hypothetical protein